MPVDYDLVILGGSAIARYAAARAAQTYARVALVEPASTPTLQFPSYRQTLIQTAAIAQQMRQASLWGLGDAAVSLNWQETIALASGVSESLQVQGVAGQSLELLAAAGVDVVVGQGEFRSQPLGLSVGGRVLRSRRYLLAPAAQPLIPAIEGLASINYLTLETLWQQSELPDRLIILGGNPQGVELAQALNRLGVQVTWVSGDRLLPQEDPETVALLQIQLQTEGLHLLPQSQVQQVRQVGDSLEVITDRQRLSADAVLLATTPQLDLTLLNLAAIGVRWQPQGVAVDRQLRTRNKQVYACGEALGGYPLFSLARYEAEVALHNALFLPTAKVNYRHTPIALFTQPECVRIGLTEAAAKQRFREAPVVLRQFSKTLAKAQLQNETTGFCKLIVRQNGEILGAQWVGAGASEGIGTIALAIQQRISVKAIAQLPILSPTAAELLQETAQQWQQQRLTQRQGWLETWFSLRRDWF
ncbi:NAD(P)/FAD-dependent oxidoreductase [Phormidium tenue FACHB-886]|nr:NAD(P)/FAD-dependent oxidoreductase [Phormidium tenue FACHB-886]